MINITVYVSCPHCGQEDCYSVDMSKKPPRKRLEGILYSIITCKFCIKPILIYWPNFRNLAKFKIFPLNREVVNSQRWQKILAHILNIIANWNNQKIVSHNEKLKEGQIRHRICTEISEINLLRSSGKPPINDLDFDLFRHKLKNVTFKRQAASQIDD